MIASPSRRLQLHDPIQPGSWESLEQPDLRARLAGVDEPERLRLLAREIDVWQFMTPKEVAVALPRIAHRLGRRRRF